MDSNMLIQVAMSFIISAAFSVIFNVRDCRIFVNGAGGAVCWTVYLISYAATESNFVSFFISTAAVAMGCYILARLIKTPVTLMLVPMILPLVPGGVLYNTLFRLISGDAEMAMIYFRELVIELAAMNLAIVFAATFFDIFYSVRRYLRPRKL